MVRVQVMIRLLFDQNLSYRLVSLPQDIYPQSAHVRLAGLAGQDDLVIWEYARFNGFVIVSKDSDYLAIGARLGHLLKVVRIGLGNCPTAEVAELLRFHYDELLRFYRNEDGSFIELR